MESQQLVSNINNTVFTWSSNGGGHWVTWTAYNKSSELCVRVYICDVSVWIYAVHNNDAFVAGLHWEHDEDQV